MGQNSPKAIAVTRCVAAGRHRMMSSLFLVLALLASLPSAVHSAPRYQVLLSFLVTLPGWQAEDPEGQEMASKGGSLTAVAREYQRGEQEISVSIWVTSGGDPVPATQGEHFSMQSKDGAIELKEIDGFTVHTVVDGSGRSGAVMVVLTERAMFGLTFENIAADEAMALARRFDWKGMKEKAQALH